MPICTNCKGNKTVITQPPAFGGIRVEVRCPVCKGVGTVDEPGVCKRCNGSKTVIADRSIFGDLRVEVACPDCSDKSPAIINVEATVIK